MNIDLKKEVKKILSQGFQEKIECNNCIHDGDASNCSGCSYNGDYFYLNGECISRNCQESKWKQIKILDSIFSGTNEEIMSIPLMGWSEDTPHTVDIIAVVWKDLSKKNTAGVKYKDISAEDDNYALSCIIEALRKLN